VSTTTPPADPRAPLPPAVVILGNDAQLAARPATPVQLAHACLAAGFRAAIPASWGDELVAAATLGVIESRPVRPVIQCACPHVARRMLAVGTELAANLVSLVAPPVAVAKYLRSHSPGGIRVTYVGRCPAASDDSIDARLTPEELLAQLAERGIELLEQPEVFESVIPPDRRRHWSQPGGLPAPDQLWNRTRLRAEALGGEELATDVAERVLSRADVLIDIAVASGCVCSGAIRGATAEHARQSIAALEPPRSPTAVIDDRGLSSLDLPIPIAARTLSEIAIEPSTRPAPPREEHTAPPFLPVMPLGTPAPEGHSRRPRLTPPGLAAIAGPQAAPPPTPPSPRRRSPTGVVRVVPPGSVPVATDPAGRVLPRAYVARRRSPRGGVPVVSDQALASSPASDTEREIEHSIEPAAEPPREAATPITQAGPAPATFASVTPPAPAVASRAKPSASPEAFAPVARSLEYLAANRRLAIVAGITVAVLTLGVAIGYAAGRRGAAEQQGTSALSPTLRVDSSAASAAPGLGASRPATRSQPTGTSSRTPPASRASNRRVARGTTADTRREVPTSEPAPSTPAATPGGTATPSAAPVTPAIDSAAIRARRDSTTAVARAESLAAERESIRREIERRRARMDSLVRAQQGNPPSSP